jgi:dTDP-4-dehydrorhamnose reductase
MISQHFIVVGGDGQLGSSLTLSLKQAGQHVHSTFFNADHVSADHTFLDLSGDVGTWQIPGTFNTAFLCAGVASIENCRTRPMESRKVNVENTLALARRLSDAGAALFFPSTNLVFDGQRPFQEANDPVNPCCEYGRQKVETERGLCELTEKAAIVRFTKIIGRGMPLFRKWIDDLKHERTIHPFSDMVLAPVSLRFATETIISIVQGKKYGIWQVSAGEDVSYEQVARYLADKVGVSQRYIDSVKIENSGIKFETNPVHTTLDISRLKNELGIEPPHIWDTIDEAFR